MKYSFMIQVINRLIGYTWDGRCSMISKFSLLRMIDQYNNFDGNPERFVTEEVFQYYARAAWSIKETDDSYIFSLSQ